MPRKSKEQERKEKQYQRQNDWQKENTKKYSLRLSFIQDAEMIAFLEKKESKAGYIKELIKKDMEAGK